MTWLDANRCLAEAREDIHASEHSRIVVPDADLDHVAGVALEHELLTAESHRTRACEGWPLRSSANKPSRMLVRRVRADVGIGPYVAWLSWSQVYRRGVVVVSALLGGGIAVLTTAGLAAVGWLQGPTWFGADAAREALVLAVVGTAVSVWVGALAGGRRSQRG